MHPIRYIHAVSFGLFISSLSHATVGGGQSIEILGYEANDQKVYLLREYEDARGRLPQLYYYDLKSNQPDQLIEVKSIYVNPTTAKVDHDNRWNQVKQSIQHIKNRLHPLLPLRSANFNFNLQQKIDAVPSWHDPAEKMRQYQYQYTISESSLSSRPQKAISYKAGLAIQQAYQIPHQDKMIVTVKYLAFPEETGYTTEDPVMLTPRQ